MKRVYLGMPFCALAFGSVACEKHPLPGEPAFPLRPQMAATAPGHREQHAGGKTPAPHDARDDAAQPAAATTAAPPPADPPKPADAPKFFPPSAK